MPPTSTLRVALVTAGGLALATLSGAVQPRTSQPATAAVGGSASGTGSGGVASQPGQTPPASAITFVDTAASAAVVDDKGTLSLDVLVTNAAAPAADATEIGDNKPTVPNVAVKAFLRSAQMVAVGTKDSEEVFVPPGTSLMRFAMPVAATRAQYPLNGLLVMSEIGKSSKPSTLTLSGIALDSPGTADWPIVYSAALAALAGLVVALLTLFWRIKGSSLSARMGPAGPSLADGWSAALMIAGPLLTTIFTVAGFPESPASMAKKTYLMVTFVLSVLIAVGPKVYALYTVPTMVKDALGTRTIQNQGLSSLFLLSAWLTLTGCLAQLALLQLVFRDLTTAHAFSKPVGDAMDLLLWGLWWAVAIYGPVAAQNTVKAQYDLAVAAKAAEEAAMKAVAVEQAAADAARKAEGAPADASRDPVRPVPSAPSKVAAPSAKLPEWSAL